MSCINVDDDVMVCVYKGLENGGVVGVGLVELSCLE